MEDIGSIILINTLCASIFTFIHVFGKASFSRIDVATLKNWEIRVIKRSRPSMSRLDSKKVVMCFIGEDKIRTKNTMAVSPRLGYNTSSASLDVKMLLTPRGGSGNEVIREKGYDSGKVTGNGDLIVEGVLVFSIALFDARL